MSPAINSRPRAISGVPVIGVGLLYQQGYFRPLILGDIRIQPDLNHAFPLSYAI